MKIYRYIKIEYFLLSAPFIILLGFRFAGFDGLYGQDSYEYLRYTTCIKDFFITNIHPGENHWPEGYPLISAVFSLIIPLNAAVQLVSLLSLYGTFYFAYKICKSIYKENTNTLKYLIVSLLFSPFILRGSIISMSDMLAVFCITGSTFYLICYIKFNKLRFILLSVLFGSYAVFTRYASAVPVFIIFSGLTFYWFKKIKPLHLIALIIPVVLIFVHFYFSKTDSDLLQHYSLKMWHFKNFFKSSFSNSQVTYSYYLPNILYTLEPLFHPGFFILNIALVFYFLKKGRLKLSINIFFIVLIILCYAFFLSGIPLQSNRFLILTYPLLLILLQPAFEIFINRFEKLKKLILAFLILIQLAFFIKYVSPVYNLSVLEKKIASEMRSFQNQTLYSFDIDIALEGRGLKFEYLNLWVEKYAEFKIGALVLFNEEKFKDQWKERNPMINWISLNENYSLILIKKLDSGWELYKIED